MRIPLESIRLDQRAQPRAVLDTALTAEYSEAMSRGESFPPLVVFYDGGTYWLADGFHRHYAAAQAGLRDLRCISKQGGLRDAILHSCQANALHGWRRSNEDKRRAVMRLLTDAEWVKWSDREIARRCKVSQPFVAKLRPSVTANVGSESRTYTTKHGTVANMATSRIGERSSRSAAAGGEAGAKPAAGSHAQSTAEFGPAHDLKAPLHHAAVSLLARSIRDFRATPDEITASCEDEEDRMDLLEACDGARLVLSGVVLRLRQILDEAA